MPRPLRFLEPRTAYHLIFRFVAGEWFIRTDEERERYLYLLRRSLVESDWRCLAYAIMSNHIHLVMIAGLTPIASWLRRVHAPFAGWINERSERIGAVFTRGPNDICVEPVGVSRVIAYVHNNPVRAAVVDDARSSDWTSHRAYLGESRQRWLHVDEGLELSGFADRDAFDVWVRSAPQVRPDVDLSIVQRTLHARRRLDAATASCGVDSHTRGLPVRHTSLERVDPHAIVDATAAELGLSYSELCSRKRSSKVVHARRVVVETAQRLGVSPVEIAGALEISSQSVYRLRAAMSDQRGDTPSQRVGQAVQSPLRVARTPQ